MYQNIFIAAGERPGQRGPGVVVLSRQLAKIDRFVGQPTVHLVLGGLRQAQVIRQVVLPGGVLLAGGGQPLRGAFPDDRSGSGIR